MNTHSKLLSELSGKELKKMKESSSIRGAAFSINLKIDHSNYYKEDPIYSNKPLSFII